MKKLVIFTTVPLSLATLVKGQPKYLSSFFNVYLVTSNEPINSQIEKYEGVKLEAIDMSRKITPFKDLKSLITIYIYLKKIKPDIVYSFTPKAGLLAMIASFFARVPIRVHNIVGMPLMEAKGNKKRLLKLIEKLTYAFSTNLFCNSFGLQKYVNRNLTKKEVKVIANGSINGVNTEFFKDSFSISQKESLREKLNIKKDDFVFIFIGRVVKDKGINELVEAFSILKKSHKSLKLLIVGDFEEHLNAISQKSMDLMMSDSDIIRIDFQKDIRPYLSISHIFILPSYREGLPNSLIEAGSFGLPLVATNINGCNEIIIDRENGILVEKKNLYSLVNVLLELIEDKNLYNKIKDNVRNSIIKRYNQEFFLKELKDELEKLL